MAIIHVTILFGPWGRFPIWMNVADDFHAQTGYNNPEWIFVPFDPRPAPPWYWRVWPGPVFLGPGSNLWYQFMLAVYVLGTVEELDDIFDPW